MGLHRLVEKVLTGVQFGTAYADEIRAIPFARAGPIVTLVNTQPEMTALTSGTLFIVRSTGTFTILMPNPLTVGVGNYWDFFNAVNQNLTFDSETDEILGYGADAAVSLLRANQASEKTGWGVRWLCDGVQLIPMIHLADADQTIAHVS